MFSRPTFRFRLVFSLRMQDKLLSRNNLMRLRRREAAQGRAGFPAINLISQQNRSNIR